MRFSAGHGNQFGVSSKSQYTNHNYNYNDDQMMKVCLSKMRTPQTVLLLQCPLVTWAFPCEVGLPNKLTQMAHAQTARTISHPNIGFASGVGPYSKS